MTDNIGAVQKQVDQDDAAGNQKDRTVAMSGDQGANNRPQNIANVHETLILAKDATGQLLGTMLGQHGLNLREKAGIGKTDQEAANSQF